MARISITTYKNSKLATFVSFLSSMCFVMAAIFMLIGFMPIIEGHFRFSDLMFGIVCAVIMFGIGFGLSVLANKIAENKQKKMNSQNKWLPLVNGKVIELVPGIKYFIMALQQVL